MKKSLLVISFILTAAASHAALSTSRDNTKLPLDGIAANSLKLSGQPGSYYLPASSAVTAGGGNAYMDIILPAYLFSTQGFTDTATINTDQYQQTYSGAVSTIEVISILLPDVTKPNFAQTTCMVPGCWAASDVTIDVSITGSIAGNGNTWIEIGLSTSGLTGLYTVYTATTTFPAAAWDVVHCTVTVPSATGLFTANNYLYVNLGRNNADTNTNDIRVLGVTFKNNILVNSALNVQYSTITIIMPFISTGVTTASMINQTVDIPCIGSDYIIKSWDIIADAAGTFTLFVSTAIYGNTPSFPATSILQGYTITLNSTAASSGTITGAGTIPCGGWIRGKCTAATTINQATVGIHVWTKK